MTVLGFQTLRNITKSGQRVNKALLNSIHVTKDWACIMRTSLIFLWLEWWTKVCTFVCMLPCMPACYLYFLKGWKWVSESQPYWWGHWLGGLWVKTAIYCFINKGMLASAGQGFTFDPLGKRLESSALCISNKQQHLLKSVCVHVFWQS